VTDIDRPWVIDDSLSPRWPVYTRANVGEVVPDVVTPLMWTAISGFIVEHEWRAALVDFGAFEPAEFRPEDQDIEGVFYGYCYINLSVQWTFGVRMPGATPELIGRTYFGERADAPAYRPDPRDDAPQLTERITASAGRVLGAESVPGLAEAAAHIRDLRRNRPDLVTLSEIDLLARYRMVMDEYRPVLRRHMALVYESSVATGVLDQALAALGDPGLSVRLMSGLGSIASAAPTMELWPIARRVATSPGLSAEFDAGIDGLLDRLRARTEPWATDFLTAYDAFIDEYGSRSASEYDAITQSWETHPAIPLALLGRMRLQPEDRDPRLQSERLRLEREELTADVRARLADQPETLAVFEAGLRAVAVQMPARELSKTTMVRALHEARLSLREIAVRGVDRGDLSRIEDLGMLTLAEVERFVAEPGGWLPLIEERWAWYEELQQREPPFVVDATVPPPSTWPVRKESPVTAAVPGEVLLGEGACPGTATGVARVINSPVDATDLQPGEILVAPETDPGWTPLFVSSSAIVVNVGSRLSHAAIVSRELGVPCVVAVDDATRRIADGTRLTVDGTAGTVTVH
jgi:phosphohistidine swiveling domain-containing protein